MSIGHSILANALALGLLCGGAPALAAESVPASNCPRLALLIGNAGYAPVWGHLENTLNDAEDLAKRLKELGWQTQVLKDGNYRTMTQELEKLVTRAKEHAACQILVYFSGHGQEWERGTFLIPVDLETDIGGMVESHALSLQNVVTKLQRTTGIKLVMLDACRSRPGGKGGTATLPEPAINSNDVLVAYATQSSLPASDKGPRNGVYAQGLLSALSDKSLANTGGNFHNVMSQVEKVVPELARKLTGREQWPTEYGSSSTRERFVFANVKAQPNAQQIALETENQRLRDELARSQLAQVQTYMQTPATPAPVAQPASPQAPSRAPDPVTQASATPMASASAPAAASAPSSASVSKPAAVTADDEIKWIWPTSGPVLSGFNEAKNMGLDIGGAAGDPVLAAADGRVVFVGSGIRGYGNLIILKHNNTYLTAYAHNQTILIKEDQSVKKGQKIAEMGSSEADRVKLHFEVRRQGKPMDPARFLPAR